jgi:uncharacterized protein YjiS (DUF1127 family)
LVRKLGVQMMSRRDEFAAQTVPKAMPQEGHGRRKPRLTHEPLARRLATLAAAVLAYWRRTMDERRARRELSALSDRMLADIGIRRHEAEYLVRHGREERAVASPGDAAIPPPGASRATRGHSAQIIVLRRADRRVCSPHRKAC